MPFEAVLVRATDRAQSQRLGQTLLLAAVAHFVLLSAMLLKNGWHVDELNPPDVPLKLFQPPAVQPVQAAAAGPIAKPKKPAAAASKQRIEKQATEVVPSQVVAPQLEQAEANDDSMSKQAEASATANGLGGPGSQGFGAAGTGDTPITPVLPPKVGAQHCLQCPNPHLPPSLIHVSSKITMAARICVDKTGRVTDVKVLQGVSPTVDAQVADTVRQWKFSPMTVNGNPVPFCYPAVFVWKGVG